MSVPKELASPNNSPIEPFPDQPNQGEKGPEGKESTKTTNRLGNVLEYAKYVGKTSTCTDLMDKLRTQETDLPGPPNAARKHV